MAKYRLGGLAYELCLEEGGFGGKLDNAENKVKQFEESCKKAGANLSKYVTLPIIALGTAAVKFAADAEVSTRKFATAFKGAETEAAAAVEALNKQYKISQTQSRSLLAFTGDLLKGFGATSAQAIKTSLSVQQLAASLAAYNGIPVQQASEAITKAMLGETEGLKTLGVAIREDLIQKQLMLEGNDKLSGTTLNLAKANAVLKLAYDQSGDAVSSFAENTETASAKAAQLMGELQDAAVSLGQQLLPVVKDVIDGVKGAVEWFTKLDDGTKRIILIFAAVAAAAGPVIGAIGGITKAINFMLANPWVLAIAGIVAGLTAIIAIASEYGDTQKNLETATDNLIKSNNNLKKINEELTDSTRELNKEEKETLKNRIDLEKQNFKGALAAQIKEIDNFKTASDDLNKQLQKNTEYQAYWQKKIKEGDTALHSMTGHIGMYKAIDAATILSREYNELTGRQDELNASYNRAVNELAKLVNEKAIEIDQIRIYNPAVAEQIALRAEELKQLQAKEEVAKEIATADADRKAADKAAAEAYMQRQKEVADLSNKILEDQKTNLEKLIETRKKLYSITLASAEEEAKRQQAILEIEKKIAAEIASIAEKVAKKISSAKQAAHDKALEQIEEERQARLTLCQDMERFYQNYIQSVFNMFSGFQQARINAIDAETQAQIDSLDKKALGEEEYNKKVSEIEKKAALKTWEIEVQMFHAKQLADVAALTMNSIVAGMKAFADLGPIGGAIASVLIGLNYIAGLAQLLSQAPPPRPRLAGGGEVLATPGGVPATLGEGGYNEVVLPLTAAVLGNLAKALVSEMIGNLGAGSGGSRTITQPFIIQINSRVIYEDLLQASDDGLASIRARAVLP